MDEKGFFHFIIKDKQYNILIDENKISGFNNWFNFLLTELENLDSNINKYDSYENYLSFIIDKFNVFCEKENLNNILIIKEENSKQKNKI